MKATLALLIIFAFVNLAVPCDRLIVLHVNGMVILSDGRETFPCRELVERAPKILEEGRGREMSIIGHDRADLLRLRRVLTHLGFQQISMHIRTNTGSLSPVPPLLVTQSPQ